jgi:hypothetical protein
MNNHFVELDVVNFKKEIKNKETILIDIRTKEEWKTYGVIPNTDKYIVF